VSEKYEPTDTEKVLADQIEEGEFGPDGGTLGDADFEEAVTTLQDDGEKTIIVNQEVETVTGTFVGVKIDRLG